MPIYAYRCDTCGHAQDVLQKLSDAPLTVCPACFASAFKKQVTAAGFQLKGSGWYVTDFRGDPKAAKPAGETANGDGVKAEPADAAANKREPGKAEPGKAESSGKADAPPAASPPAAKAPPAAPSTTSGTGTPSAGQ